MVSPASADGLRGPQVGRRYQGGDLRVHRRTKLNLCASGIEGAVVSMSQLQRTDDVARAGLRDDARTLAGAVVVNRRGVGTRDPIDHQRPEPVVALANLVLRHRMTTGAHPVLEIGRAS